MAKIPDPNIIYGIPLDDGSFTLIQTIENIKLLNGYAVAIFKNKYSESDLPNIKLNIADVLMILVTTRDLMTKSVWLKMPVEPICISSLQGSYEKFRNNGWIGLQIYGSGIIVKMMNAYNGLRDWKMMKDPKEFDKIMSENSIHKR